MSISNFVLTYPQQIVDAVKVFVYHKKPMISVWNPDKIKAARNARGLRTNEAAQLLNITPEYLSMIEGGSRTPSSRVIIAMARTYRKEVADFLRDEKNLYKASTIS